MERRFLYSYFFAILILLIFVLNALFDWGMPVYLINTGMLLVVLSANYPFTAILLKKSIEFSLEKRELLVAEITKLKISIQCKKMGSDIQAEADSLYERACDVCVIVKSPNDIVGNFKLKSELDSIRYDLNILYLKVGEAKVRILKTSNEIRGIIVDLGICIDDISIKVISVRSLFEGSKEYTDFTKSFNILVERYQKAKRLVYENAPIFEISIAIESAQYGRINAEECLDRLLEKNTFENIRHLRVDK